MEENQENLVREVTDQTNPSPETGAWVSPDVAAAEAGESVDFSKNVVSDEDSEKE